MIRRESEPGMVTLASDTSPHSSAKHLPFRPDIEGLRALAVGGVLLFHAGWPIFAGGYVGVDVFFVLSGFLMTALIVREWNSPSGLDLLAFYGRRVRRIIPAAAVVLVASAIFSLLVLPWVDWTRTAWDVLSAGFFVSNFRFALGATDYLAEDFSASPVLNYWSLSVEEQFYLVWPLLLVGLLLARRARIVLVGLAIVSGLSFGYSLWLTENNQPWAFFMMPTRAWEFAIGGAVALLAHRFTSRGVAATIAGWLGGVAVLLAMVMFSRTTSFPGWAAALPALGTAAILWAGAAETARGTFASLLSWHPLRAVGRISYSWYLWHFPPLILVPIWLDRELDPLFGTIVVLVSWLPAYLTYRLVETPIRRTKGKMRSNRGALAILLVSLALVGLAAAVLFFWPRPQVEVASSEVPADGAAEQTRQPEAAATLTPTIENARDDIPVVYEDDCHFSVLEVELKDCIYGDKNSDTTVFLVGDSHAAQWQPALARIAAQEGWKLRSLTKSSCAPGAGSAYLDEPYSREYRECQRWLVNVNKAIRQDKPELVVASGWQPEEIVIDGDVETGPSAQDRYRRDLQKDLSDLRSNGTSLIWLEDTPWPDVDVPACLAKKGTAAECSVPLPDALPDPAGSEQALALGVPVISMTDSICGPVECEAIRFNRIVWRDKHHLTASYSEALAPVLREAISESEASAN